MHRVTQRVFIPHLRLASKVEGEPLKSDFTIDLKHEVSATVTAGRSRFVFFPVKKPRPEL